MKINKSGAGFSSIVGIGEKIAKIKNESGQKWLELNRGVNSVVNIDLTEVKKLIDFNSKEFQLYAPNTGFKVLKENINKEYFSGNGDANNIFISPGGMPALDLIIQILNVDNIYFPHFYWGSYSKMATIRNKSFSFYDSLDYFDLEHLNENTCIFICDPNNPTGIKMDEQFLSRKIKEIADTGAIIIFDSPYRKLFYNDNFFEKILHPNVIIAESFSKWIGLPGARLGFIYSQCKEFNEELNIRMLYEFNGISSPSQILVNTILTTNEGRKSILDFQEETTEHIFYNINYLKDNNLLVDDVYGGNIPIGIFAVINKSEDFLFQHKIGAVGLDKFVYYDKDTWSSYSRICVSVDHELFKEFISKII